MNKKITYFYEDPFEKDEKEFDTLEELLEECPALSSLFPDFKGDEKFLWDGTIEINNAVAPFKITVVINP